MSLLGQDMLLTSEKNKSASAAAGCRLLKWNTALTCSSTFYPTDHQERMKKGLYMTLLPVSQTPPDSNPSPIKNRVKNFFFRSTRFSSDPRIFLSAVDENFGSGRRW